MTIFCLCFQLLGSWLLNFPCPPPCQHGIHCFKLLCNKLWLMWVPQKTSFSPSSLTSPVSLLHFITVSIFLPLSSLDHLLINSLSKISYLWPPCVFSPCFSQVFIHFLCNLFVLSTWLCWQCWWIEQIQTLLKTFNFEWS